MHMKPSRTWPRAALVLTLVSAAACSTTPTPQSKDGDADLSSFLGEANETLLRLSNEANQAGWVQQTYITPDTEAISSRADQAFVTAVTDYAKKAVRFDAGSGTPDEQRQLTVLKNTLTMAAPSNPSEAGELTRLVTSMGGTYGRGKYCPKDETSEDACLDVEEITEILAKSREPARLLEVWEGWHTIAPPMKPSYQRFVELSNKGARELGFADTGAMWRSRYDMAPDAFAKELDRLWAQLRPLYLSLHTHVRAKLQGEVRRRRTGGRSDSRASARQHLGAGLVECLRHRRTPRYAAHVYSLTSILQSRRIAALDMVRYGEGFFTSLGFDPLPKTFWERSLFVKPRDRDVVCHASAWYIDNADDLRIKMCIDPTAEDFTTVHHELGHDFYGREYKTQPMIFRDSANDGFHEAIGDTIALSVTPEYLVKIGLLDKAPDASGDIPLLLRAALEKLAFLPFGLVVDQWRWQVFSGQVKPDQYNAAWWTLRTQYQGVAPPSQRGEQFFDPGAKYHMPANTPYARYFLAAGTPVPVPPRACEDVGLHDAAPSLLDLRQQGRRRAVEKDARDGCVPPVARCARSAHRATADGRHRDRRLLCAAESVAGPAEQRPDPGLVMMNDFGSIEDWTNLNKVLLPFMVRCGAAAICGAMVGLERELRNKPAGFRTNILICLGAAMYTTVGVLLVRDGDPAVDPTRIAAQVVTGIGFLGAGCVIQAGGRVTGLTSAATIWVVAAIGVVAGVGFPILAFFATCMVVLTLAALRGFENRFLDTPVSDENTERDR